MKQTLITTLALGLSFLSLLTAPSAHAQRYLVNGHPATAREEQVLASYGFDAGAWRMDGWGISLDVAHAENSCAWSRNIPRITVPPLQACTTESCSADCREEVFQQTASPTESQNHQASWGFSLGATRE